MLNCKEVTELASKAHDAPLTLNQRIQLKLHLFMCKLCTRYVKQLKFLRAAVQNIDEQTPQHHLSTEGRSRIRQALEEETKS